MKVHCFGKFYLDLVLSFGTKKRGDKYAARFGYSLVSLNNLIYAVLVHASLV